MQLNVRFSGPSPDGGVGDLVGVQVIPETRTGTGLSGTDVPALDAEGFALSRLKNAPKVAFDPEALERPIEGQARGGKGKHSVTWQTGRIALALLLSTFTRTVVPTLTGR